MNVAIYSRVSSIDQNVQQQSKYLRNWCKSQGYTVVESVLDTESGTLPLRHRKKFRKLLNPKNKYRAIVVYNLDRLTRNWYDENFIEQMFFDNWSDLQLISTCEPIDLSTASGRMMFRMKLVVSCFMPEDMKEKQKIGISRAKKEGKYKGRKKGSKNKK